MFNKTYNSFGEAVGVLAYVVGIIVVEVVLSENTSPLVLSFIYSVFLIIHGGLLLQVARDGIFVFEDEEQSQIARATVQYLDSGLGLAASGVIGLIVIYLLSLW